jgi:hypothetical protein
MIAAIGDGVDAVSRLSLRRGSRLAVFDGARELSERIALDRGRHSWLIAPGCRASVADVSEICLAACAAGTSIGFVASRSRRGARAHASKIGAYRWAAPPRALLWSSSGFGGLSPTTVNGLTIVSAGDRQIDQKLDLTYGLIALVGHGLGADAEIGGAYLCSLSLPRPRGKGGARTPPCHHGGPCIRHPDPGSGLLPSVTIPPSRLRADVVLLGHCNGLLLPGRPLSAESSVAHDLAEGQWAGAVLTTYMDTPIPAYVAPFAWELLRRGHTVGQVCCELNNDVSSIQPGAPWLVLGDPDAVLGRPDRPKPAGTSTAFVVRPGDVVIFPKRRSGSDVQILRVTGNSNGSREWFHAEMASGRGLALYAGGVERHCELTTWSAGSYPAWTRKALSSAMAGSALGSAARFLEALAAFRPQSTESTTATTAREVSRRRLDAEGLWSVEQFARRWSGVEGYLLRRAELERTSWELLCRRLADVLEEHATAPATVSPSPARTADAGSRGEVLERRCPYCGMPVVQRRHRMAEVRRVVSCFGCGLIWDLPDDAVTPSLGGPTRIPRDATSTFRMSIHTADRRGEWYVDARLTVEHSRLHPAIRRGRAEGWHRGRQVTIDIPLHVGAEAAPGVHTIVLAAVAGGRLLFGRRPVTVI